MADNQLAVTLRQRLARFPGLDPRAVLAVAQQEGLGGGIGDQGTSFGPFQLHYGGAYPGFAPRGAQASQAWASSPEGIDYALARINSVAHGYKGMQAIRAIVSQFERPANPDREIAGALGAYGGVPSGRGGSPAPMRAGGYSPPGVSSSGVPSEQYRNMRLALSLLGFKAPPAPARQPGVAAAMVPQAGGSFAPPAGGAHGLIAPVSGKLIGQPYQGTHGREFNARGGSNNWESENAVDVAVPVGTPIRAAADGVIGSQFGSLGEGGRFAGLRLHLNTGNNELYYAHLSRYAPGIQPGARVRRGQIIGYSGEANGVAHLHLALESGNPAALYG